MMAGCLGFGLGAIAMLLTITLGREVWWMVEDCKLPSKKSKYTRAEAGKSPKGVGAEDLAEMTRKFFWYDHALGGSKGPYALEEFLYKLNSETHQVRQDLDERINRLLDHLGLEEHYILPAPSRTEIRPKSEGDSPLKTEEKES